VSAWRRGVVPTADQEDRSAQATAEATSLTLSLADAIQAAVAKLPAGPGDTGHSVVIEEISYSDGGIVGPALHVRVRSKR
jgi:hypothetical protein